MIDSRFGFVAFIFLCMYVCVCFKTKHKITNVYRLTEISCNTASSTGFMKTLILN